MFSSEKLSISWRQTSVGWCTAYALASIFRDEAFLKYTEKPEYKGCDTEKINTMLAETGTRLKVQTIAQSTQGYLPLPKNWVYELMKSFSEPGVDGMKLAVVPYLLTVSLVPGIYHSIGVLVIDGFVVYIDPYRADYLIIENESEFENLFMEVIEVERFVVDDKFAILYGERLDYHILLKEIKQKLNVIEI